MPTIEIYRVRIDPANVDRLLEIRAAAVAEFQEQVPELQRAEMHALIAEELGHDRGELVHGSTDAWATAR